MNSSSRVLSWRAGARLVTGGDPRSRVPPRDPRIFCCVLYVVLPHRGSMHRTFNAEWLCMFLICLHHKRFLIASRFPLCSLVSNGQPWSIEQLRISVFCVRRRDVLIHGYTRNCGRCNAISAGRSWTNAHSTACRRRFAKLLPDRFCIGKHSQCNDPPPEVVLTLVPGESCKRMRLSLKVWVTVEMDLGEQNANIERA